MCPFFHSLPTVLVLLAVAFALPACDDVTEQPPDAERIVGTWNVETVNVTTGIGISVPVLDVEAGGDESAFSFESDRSFAFTFDPNDGRVLEIVVAGTTLASIPLTQTVTLNGTYELQEGTRDIVLTTVAAPGGITMGYEFQGNDGLELTAEDPETLALFLGLAGDEFTVFSGIVTGGSFALHGN